MTTEGFQAQKHSFETEVIIEVTDKGVVGKGTQGSINIDAINLDNFKYIEHLENRISTSGLWFRFIAISLGLLILSETIFGGWSAKSWTLAIVLAVINFLVAMIFIFDALLEFNIFKSIVDKNFSNHLYHISIGNKSGNNINFFAEIDELNKINKLEQNINELKKLTSDKTTLTSDLKPSYLDELKKLGELHKSGILTEEEFSLKKQQLLNK